jgi:hypothetical protein
MKALKPALVADPRPRARGREKFEHEVECIWHLPTADAAKRLLKHAKTRRRAMVNLSLAINHPCL